MPTAKNARQIVEAINEGLRKIGCFSAASDRTDLEDATEETGAELNGVSLCEDPEGDGAGGDLVAV